MAVASYDSDLTSANGGELAIGSIAGGESWDESTNATYDDGGGPIDETDFYIEGTSCISAQFTKTGIGTIINIQGTPFTVDANGAILIWAFWASPPSLETYANGGMRTLVGNSLADFKQWQASGSDFEPNPFGGWYCYAVDPSLTGDFADVGSPSGTWTHVGMIVNATAQARGQPFAVDAIRVGRCTMEVTGGDGTGTISGQYVFENSYGNFLDMASFDTSTSARYGLFQQAAGSYRWQGLMSLGTSATAVDFRDANRTIVVANTPRVQTAFNRIEVRNASSNIVWNSLVFSSPGVNNLVATTASKGQFEVVDNATVALDSCSFSDMDTFIFNGGTNANSASSCTWSRCNTVTQNNATLTSCVFSNTTSTTSALVVNSLGSVTTCTFIGDGTTAPGHAVDLGTMTGTGQVIEWNNTLNNGSNQSVWAGTTQSPTAGTQGTVNSAITVNIPSGSDLKISVTGGTIPTVQNTGTGTLEITANEVTTQVIVYDASVTPPALITDSSVNVYLTAAAGGSLAQGTQIIKGSTNASGLIADLRSWASDQPVTGWARRSSSGFGALPSGTTYFETGNITGTISSANGATFTVLMQPDEG